MKIFGIEFFRKEETYKLAACIYPEVKVIETPTETPEEEFVLSPPPPGVSEPVLAFVKAVRENPKRFRFKYGAEYDIGVATDLEKNLVFNYYTNIHHITERSGSITRSFTIYELASVVEAPFLTYVESQYLFKEIEDVYKIREERLKHLKEKRKERANEKLRKHFTDIYAGG